MAKTPEIEGVKEAVRALRKIDPAMRKTFNTNVKAVVAPMTNAMQSNYDDARFPSGTKRKWGTQAVGAKARKINPLTAASARRGVRVKIDTNRKSGAAFTVMQTNPGAAIFDMAGNGTPLGRAFTAKFGRSSSRVMWPNAEVHLDDVRENLVELIQEIEQDINRELQRRG
tara:strand:+ start:218 stop:727 length:510 start_codon:yes stop_codon:yes gene_type:complete